MNISDLKTVINHEKKRFEIALENRYAFIDFITNTQGEIFLTHTEVPHSFEGQGIAGKLAQDALAWIEENNLKLFPLCPYIAAYIKRHPEYRKLLANGVNI